MKNGKKILFFMLTVLIVSLLSFALSGCGCEKEEPYAAKSYGEEKNYPENYQDIRTEMYDILTTLETSDGESLRDTIASSKTLTKSLKKTIETTIKDGFAKVDDVEDVAVATVKNPEKDNMIDVTVTFTYKETGAADSQTTSFTINVK